MRWNSVALVPHAMLLSLFHALSPQRPPVLKFVGDDSADFGFYVIPAGIPTYVWLLWVSFPSSSCGPMRIAGPIPRAGARFLPLITISFLDPY